MVWPVTWKVNVPVEGSPLAAKWLLNQTNDPAAIAVPLKSLAIETGGHGVVEAGVSVSVDVLLLGLESVVSGGVVTVAVFTRLPVALGETVPMTVKTTLLPAPAA